MCFGYGVRPIFYELNLGISNGHLFTRGNGKVHVIGLFTYILCVLFVDMMEFQFIILVQVLNGLLSRDNQKEAISIPIGIIPAGSDNSLVWTVLGVRDPISAAIAIVKVMLSFLRLVYSCHVN